MKIIEEQDGSTRIIKIIDPSPEFLNVIKLLQYKKNELMNETIQRYKQEIENQNGNDIETPTNIKKENTL